MYNITICTKVLRYDCMTVVSSSVSHTLPGKRRSGTVALNSSTQKGCSLLMNILFELKGRLTLGPRI